MFKRWFKRKAPDTPNPALDLNNQRPKAGEIRVNGSDETLFLAPLPVYTGQLQIGSRSFSEMNDVYLELGGSNRGMVEQGKGLAFVILIFLCLIFGAPLFIGAYLTMFGLSWSAHEIAQVMKFTLQASASSGVPVGLFLVGTYIHGMVSDVHKRAKTYPLRFNRQRREVCYVDSATHRVLIVPWESVVAWVSNSQAVTPYGATRQYCFGIGLEDEELDKVHFFNIPQFSDDHALGMWAAIRNYMEDGVLVDAPDPWLTALGLFPSGDRLKNFEGLHSFEVERDNARLMGNLDQDPRYDLSPEIRKEYGFDSYTVWPLRWWYVRRVLSFWKMPYMFAEWGHRQGRAVFPEQVRQWSQPLPPEQWATPSPALQQANQQVRFAMDKQGITFTEACKEAGFC